MNSNVSRNLIFPGERDLPVTSGELGLYTKQKLWSLNQTEQKKREKFSLLTNVLGWKKKE